MSDQYQWQALDATQRNMLIGETLGFKAITQCWIAHNGQRLLQTRWDAEQRKEAEAMCRMMQDYDQLWKDSLVEYPSLKPEMRGKLKVVIERWHIRYSDTPGGGWDVVEWLRERGAIAVESMQTGWAVYLRLKNGESVVRDAPTMAEAACLVALDVVEKGAQ